MGFTSSHYLVNKYNLFEDRILGSFFGSSTNLLGKYFHFFHLQHLDCYFYSIL